MLNEKRLIDANALRDRLKDEQNDGEPINDYGVGYWNGLTMAQSITMAFPTVDAVEVVHGRWLSVEDSLFPGTQEKCSLCGVRKGVGYVYHYCPNCGAKMDGDGNG